jgi:hypothetical protein
MRPDHPASLSALERFDELAAILAIGILRLRFRAALSPTADEAPASEKPQKSSPNCLELPGDPRLSVHTG